MLKQWFVGRKRISSAQIHPGHRQDPAVVGPLGDKYVVYRTNPIYVDDGHWLAEAAGKPQPLSVVAPHEPKLHVQTWCSLVCPQHLTTCCACKPAWIYCDNCHPPVRYRPPYPSPDVLPYSATRRVATRAHHRVPDIALSPRTLMLDEQAMDGHHFYHVIGPSTPPPEEKYPGQDQQKQTSASRSNNNYIGSRNNRNQKSSDTPPPVLHIYINSEFVSGIAVTGSSALVNQETATNTNAVPIHGQDVSLQLESTNSSGLDVSAETDSLDSLRIDEGMFDPASAGNDQSSNGSDAGGIQGLEGISPTGSKILLTDSEVAYQAVRDLYEKLSNNRQRQVVTQAMNGSQRTKVLRDYVQNTYETLTKHTRSQYGKLVEDEPKRPPLYLVPSGAAPRGRPLPEPDGSEGAGSADGVFQGSNSLRILTGSRVESVKHGKGHLPGRDQSNSVPVDSVVPDVAYELATSDQFITRRDPNYGDQVVQTSAAAVAQKTTPSFYDDLRKRFKQKNYRDACKIIATTLVGLTAFGIITALSLSINRQ